MMNHIDADAILAKIGNVVASVEIDGILYTVAADAIVRTNDIDSGLNIARVSYPSMVKAESAYADAVAKAELVAA